MNSYGIFLVSMSIFCSAVSVMMTGGWRDEPEPYNDSILNVAQSVTYDLSMSMNNSLHMKFMNLTKCRKQVVAGMQYEMSIIMGPTDCKKKGNYTESDLKNCNALPDRAQVACNVTVWVKPWENFRKITKSQCIEG